MIRKHIFVSGFVQGVFFRQFVKDNASELGLKGWVKNCSNGNVEILVEGDKESIEKLIELCEVGPSRSRVENVDFIEEKYTGDFEDFKVVY